MIERLAENLISNFDFDESIKLVKEYGDTNAGEKIASMARSSFTEKKLIKELKKILENPIVRDEKPIIKKVVIPEKELSVLDQLKFDRNELVKKRDFLRGQLEKIPTDDERMEVALKILNATKSIHQIWQDINILQSGNVIPVTEELNELDKVFAGVTNVLQLEKIRRNYISYRAKARNGSRSEDNLPFYETVISEAERRINDAIV